jgi:hypothetical protein
VICNDGDEFLRSLKGQQFDLIFADTWSGKYRLLEEALDLVSPAGIYVIDDMPQKSPTLLPNWSNVEIFGSRNYPGLVGLSLPLSSNMALNLTRSADAPLAG